LLWGSTFAVAASGLGFAWAKYLVKTDDPFAVVNHPWQPLFLKIHILSAPLLVFAFGFVFSRHVVRQWQSQQNRGKRSGLGIVSILAPLILSGYLIQTATDETLLTWFVAVHLVTGVVYLVMMPIHQLKGAFQSRRTAERDAKAIRGVASERQRRETA